MSEPADPPRDPAAVDAEALAVEANHMLRDIEHLASDDFAGRYTLADDLQRATQWLEAEYRSAGLQPVGESYAVPFPITTGAELRGEQGLVVHRRKAARPLDSAQFRPLAVSGSGHVRAPVVFVGYAAQAQATTVESAAADEEAAAASAVSHPAYDDLAGVSLEGKIALVLLDAPGRPDFRALFEKLEALAEAFARDAQPVLAAGDAAAMRGLHEKARKQLAAIIEPFTRGQALPASFWELPDEPMTDDLGLSRILAPLMAMELPGPRFEPSENFARTKLERLAAAGVAGVIFVRGPRSHLDDASRREDALPELAAAGSFTDSYPFPVVQLRWTAADKSLRVDGKTLSALQKKIDLEQVPHSREIDGVEIEITTGVAPIQRQVPNLIGRIEGTDLSDELVVLGAHYDHLGTSEQGHDCPRVERKDRVDAICNGADDNASGSAMVLELARAFGRRGIRPRRTLIFTHFAGEELGLFGSAALAEHPPWEKEKVVAMINLDMVGRLGRRGLAVGGLGSSTDWMPLLDRIGNKGMSILYERAVATRSDHASFYRQGVPVLFFFTGIHADYHRPGDHADKINVDGLRSIGELVGEVLVALADGYAVHYVAPTEGDGLSNGLPGEDPRTVEKRVVAHPD